MARKRNTGKKRTLSPEQLEKMREGRERAKRHKARMESVNDLETRLRKGARGY